MVPRRGWEPRPKNRDANQYVAVGGSDYVLVPWTGVAWQANELLLSRVEGDFTGTTDEILRWGACKWGVDEDIVRALAVSESWWDQYAVGDEGQSFGILQVKRTIFEGTWPASEKSTAFNVDYVLARWRACYDGWITYMGEGNPGYQPGDEWGCVGAHYSGQYRDADGEWYMDRVKRYWRERPWTARNW